MTNTDKSRTALASSRLKARIILVDDHPIVREGLALHINSRADMEIVGEVTSMANASARIGELRPDLVVMDIDLLDHSNTRSIKELKNRFPKLPIVVVSALDESLFADRAFRDGAHGYISTRESTDQIIGAIQIVLRGGYYASPQISGRIMGADERPENPIEKLSDRELEVFVLIGNGLKTTAIAHRLCVSSHTIDTHRENIRR